MTYHVFKEDSHEGQNVKIQECYNILLVCKGPLLKPGIVTARNRDETSQQEKMVREGSPKKNYESLDTCPNWVYPTYLVA